MPFCRHCGAKLEEGQVCTCQQNQTQQPYTEGQTQQPYTEGQTQQPYTEGQTQQPYSEGQAQQPYTQGQTQQSYTGGQQDTGGTAQSQFQQSQQAQQAQQVAAAARDNAVHAAKSLKPFFEGYITNPVQAIRTAVAANNLHLAIAMAVIRVLAVCILIGRAVGSVAGVIRTATGALGGLSSLMGDSSAAGIAVSGNLGGSVLWGIVVGVVTIALSTLMVFVMGRLVKTPVSFLQAFVGTSVNGGVVTVFILLSALCSLFSAGLAVGCLVAAVLSAAVFGVLTVGALCGEHQTMVFWGGYLLVTLVMVIIGWYVIYNCFFAALGGITVSYAGVKTSIKTVMDQFKTQFGSVDQFIDSMMSQITGGLF